ncbi:hypothetical protein TNCV_1720841 [Trichonephila clavipes]|nr:hypothetical protein TNCV_1720841 [Trichonephila clavipes]
MLISRSIKGRCSCYNEAPYPRLPDSIVLPIAIMPLSRMENTTFAMPSITDSHDIGLTTVLQSRCPKWNAYSTPQSDKLCRMPT